jgi:tripartite-type tricarboxylate transporter receptor subunit TctC
VPVTYPNLPFDPLRDLVPVIPLGNMPLVFVVSAAKGYRDLAQFVAMATANHGRTNYVSGGAGSITHISVEALRLAAGFDAVHIPQKGAPESLTEVLAERADFYFSPLTPALPLLKEGRLQALAVSGSQRARALPEIPTIREAGYPEAEYNFWIAMFVPARTPTTIRGRLHDATAKALADASLQERLGRLGVDPMPLDPATFEKLMRTEVVLNARVAQAIGLKIN